MDTPIYVTVILYVAAVLCGCLVSGLNPAIILSRLIYKEDIRKKGSGNPGFTNFKRSFGSKHAWWVFILDISKGAVLFTVFGILFSHYLGDRMMGVAVTAVAAMLGHAHPVWYGFKGGKGFLVCLTAVWFLDWRAGLVGTAVMLLLLFTTHFMSLATMVGMVTAIAPMWIFHRSGWIPAIPVILYAVCAIYMCIRHRANIGRLIEGTESKFYLKDKKKKAE